MKGDEQKSVSLSWIFKSLQSLPKGTSIRFYNLESGGIGIGFMFGEDSELGGFFVDEFRCEFAVSPDRFELACVTNSIDRANDAYEKFHAMQNSLEFDDDKPSDISEKN